MPIITPKQNMTLKQAIAIRDRGYRSKDAKRDYYPEDIDAIIATRMAKRAMTNLNQREKELLQREKERSELKALIHCIRKKGPTFLSDKTMMIIAKDIQKIIGAYL